MRRFTILLVTLLLAVGSASGQSWQQLYDEVMSSDDGDSEAALLEESYDLLDALAASPLDINSASSEELEQLPFLSSQQVMDIEEYILRYGPMRSLGELRMIRSLDSRQIALLRCFVAVKEPEERQYATAASLRLDSLLRRARHTLTATARIPMYRRAGDDSGYMGYPYRHSLRYEMSSGSHLSLGLTGAQDAGEPFFAGRNAWGYDTYSYYLQIRDMGVIDALVVGKYKVSAGMGLVLGQSFQLGKLAAVQSLGRSVRTLRPHSSRSEADYFQGVAATVRLSRPAGRPRGHGLLLTAFLSRRPADATLTADGDARTLVTSGYHRTQTEMEKKYNTHIAVQGARLEYRGGGLRVGATAVSAQTDRSLEPQRETLYRRYYPHGSHFTNASADYSLTHYRFALHGETATDDHGRLATANSISYMPSARLSLVGIQRYYSYRYSTILGHSFLNSSGSGVQNESGLLVGATWNLLAHLQLQAYADYAYFPWPRYTVSDTSHEWDMLLLATYERRGWKVQARHRTRLRQKDAADGGGLTSNDEYRERLSATYSGGAWMEKTQLDIVRNVSEESSAGWMVSQQASVESKHALAGVTAAYFDTDGYSSRIYVYERQMQHDFSFPTYYGQGMRLSLYGRADLGRGVRAVLRVGYTKYFDRSVIGTGLQQIGHSHQTDIDLQLRWRF